MFSRWFALMFERELARRESVTGRGGAMLPVGYNPTEVIRGSMLLWVQVPFCGHKVWCQLRCLNRTQLEACGLVSLIDVDGDDKKSTTHDDIIEMRNTQEKMARAVLNQPTFEEIETMLLGSDFIAQRYRDELAEIKIIDLKTCTADEKKDIELRIEKIELMLAFILPEDTMGFLTSWAIGTNVSDIKKLSRDQLLDAAILAENGHDSPHDHISGVFTDRDAGDIDKAAWSVFIEERKAKEADKKGMMIGGPKKRR